MDQPFEIDPRRLDELRRRAASIKTRDDAEAGEYQRKGRAPVPPARDCIVSVPARRGSARKPLRHDRGYKEA